MDDPGSEGASGGKKWQGQSGSHLTLEDRSDHVCLTSHSDAPVTRSRSLAPHSDLPSTDTKGSSRAAFGATRSGRCPCSLAKTAQSKGTTVFGRVVGAPM